MKEWSRLKKAAVIIAITVFGFTGLGALVGDSQPKTQPETPSVVNPTPPQVEGDITPEPPAQPDPTPPPPVQPPPPPVPEPAPAPAPSPEPQANCVPGYSPCIAPGSDVDCASGSGNGPRYVSGPVYVTGSDPYDLDRDGDGVACE